MKIVIDIPEYMYNDIKNCGYVYPVHAEDLASYIIGGTPLPRGHGRLIDAEEVKRKMGNLDGFGVIGRCIDEFPTIIEADKAESEK